MKPENITFGTLFSTFDVDTGEYEVCRVLSNKRKLKVVSVEGLTGSLEGKTWSVPYSLITNQAYYKPYNLKNHGSN